jgi:hypothetical protein
MKTLTEEEEQQHLKRVTALTQLNTILTTCEQLHKSAEQDDDVFRTVHTGLTNQPESVKTGFKWLYKET